MKTLGAKVARIGLIGLPDTGIVGIGRIVQITGDGRALVDWPGNAQGPVEARSILDAEAAEAARAGTGGATVLLVFENGDPSLPIVAGVVRDRLAPAVPKPETVLHLAKPKDALLDGRRIVLDANEEIELRCGRSSILLRKDGKIVVKGAEITSRASGTNKIRGASVKIN